MTSRIAIAFASLIFVNQTAFGQVGTTGKGDGAAGKPPGSTTGVRIYTAPKKEKDLKDMSADELLAKALKDNPDLRVAESKVREAEADLSRTRLRVMQNVSKVFQELLVAREVLAAGTQLFELTRRSAGSVNNREIMESQLAMVRLKGDVAKLEAELVLLVGKQPSAAKMLSVGSDQGVASSAERHVPAALADKVRTALDTTIKVNFEEAAPRDIIKYLSQHIDGVNLHVTAKVPDKPVSLNLVAAVPIGAVLQWLEDEFGWRCVLRDYGIVIAERDRIPPGATPLLDFWKKSKSAESKNK